MKTIVAIDEDNGSDSFLLEVRSCSMCGRQFKALSTSLQQVCSAYCERERLRSTKQMIRTRRGSSGRWTSTF